MPEHFNYTSYSSFMEYLCSFREEKYAEFQRRIIPGEKIIGVRMQRLRQTAKQIAKGDWRRFLDEAREDTMEEAMVEGFVTGYAEMPYEESLQRTAAFVPKIRSWAVCDSCTSTLTFLKKNKERSFRFIERYFSAEGEFAVRFAVTASMDFFISEGYLGRLFSNYDGIKHDGYYAKMAVAWAISMCFLKFPERTLKYLHSSRLDDWTYNKALQKIIESRCVSNETRQSIRLMKRKVKR